MSKDELLADELERLAKAAPQGRWRLGMWAGSAPQTHVVDMGEPPSAPFMLPSKAAGPYPATGVVYSDGPRSEVEAATALIVALHESLPAILTALRTPRSVSGVWQPIETAPRDGSWFLACSTTPGWGATRVVRFHRPDDRLPIHGEGVMWPSAPTHWMPLPAPPARAALQSLEGEG